MSRPAPAFAAALSLATALAATASTQAILTDPAGDARLRRTDPGQSAPVGSGNLPDILSISLCAWQSPTPATDPYTGSAVNPAGAHLFRLDLKLAGLINPPGSIGLAGLPFEPLRFGPNPVFGFVEFDMDRDKDTGGQIGSAAVSRYLANVGRFGECPEGSVGERMARFGTDRDLDFFTPPQHERSGEDFALVFCGCFQTTIVQRLVGNTNDIFEPGETWIVRGRFFQRAAGYQGASAAFGGSAFGLYDPLVNLRFSHHLSDNTTTISLVYGLTMTGAAALAGQPVQPIDLNVANHNSVAEGLQDIIDGANAGGLTGPTWWLARRWAGEDVTDALDPTRWDVTALLGVAYTTQQASSIYAWTDAAGKHAFADFDSDGFVTSADASLLQSTIASMDGGPADCDGVANNSVLICNPGPGFAVFDLNSDNRIDNADLAILNPCPGDTNGDGSVNFTDLNNVLSTFGQSGPGLIGDANGDGVVNFLDLNLVLSYFGTNC